jgi:hypothetical protein
MPSRDQIGRCKWERTRPAPQNWPLGRNDRRNARHPTLHVRQWRPVLLGWIEREEREAECWVGADQGLSGNRQPSTLGRNDRPNNGSTTDGTGIAQRTRALLHPIDPPRGSDRPSPRPPSLVCGSCSSGRSFASGFLPTPPHGDAVAVGSESAPPLPTEDLHLRPAAHAGRAREEPRQVSLPGFVRY